MPRLVLIPVIVLMLMALGCARRSPCLADWEFQGSRAGLVQDESELWIREDVARCLATEYGLEEGIRPWRMVLKNGLWYIENTLYDHGIDGRGGRAIKIDGETGEVISELGWGEIS